MNKNFTKADLKAGYVVKYRNGYLEMVLMSGVCGDKNPRLISIAEDGTWTYIDLDFDDNLCNRKCLSSKAIKNDIVEIYGYSMYASSSMVISTNNRELLWKREEEMTVADVVAEEVK